MKVINDRGVHRNLKPVQQVPPRSHLFSSAVAEQCPRQDVPSPLPGCWRASWAAARSRGMSNALFAHGYENWSRGHHRETFLSRTVPPARPCPETTGCGSPGSARRGGTHLILLLGEFPGGFGAEDWWLARGGRLCLFPNAPLSALSLSGGLRACVRLCVCASGAVWHFPCRSRLPVPAAVPHIQAGSRQAGRPARIRALLPARLSLLSAAGLPCAPAFSGVFVFPNLQSFVCVCAHAHCVFSLFFSPSQPALPDGKNLPLNRV